MKPRTQITIAGVRLWPIRWRIILIKSVRNLYNLAMLYACLIALLSSALRAPGLSEDERQVIARGLAALGANEYWQLISPLAVGWLYFGNRIGRVWIDLQPGEE